jgi:hypothetical protein
MCGMLLGALLVAAWGALAAYDYAFPNRSQGRNWAFLVWESNPANWANLNSGWALQPFDGEHHTTDFSADGNSWLTNNCGGKCTWSPDPHRFMLSDVMQACDGAKIDMYQAAIGDYSSCWLRSLRRIANAPPQARIEIVRIWQEINGNWFPWSVNQTGKTAGDGTPNGSPWPVATIKAAWHNMAMQVRTVFPDAKIEFNLNCGGPWSAPLSPGNGTGFDLTPATGDFDTYGMDCYEYSGFSVARLVNGLRSGVDWKGIVAAATTNHKYSALSETAAKSCDGSWITNWAREFDATPSALYFSYYDNEPDRMDISSLEGGQPNSCPSPSALRTALNNSSIGQKPYTGPLP